jgi:hypothetical protein
MSDVSKMDDVFDLGAWLGRKQAFAAVAGRCSAADAECLRTIRQKKLYRARGVTWQEFCPQYAGISRSLADEVIRHLEEFGPAYFHLAGVSKITPQAFRLIAPAVSEEGVQCGDETIPFTPENAGRIAAAVEELRTRAEAEPRRERAAVENRARSLARARTNLQEALTEVERVSTFEMDVLERQALRAAIEAATRRLERLMLVVPR